MHKLSVAAFALLRGELSGYDSLCSKILRYLLSGLNTGKVCQPQNWVSLVVRREGIIRFWIRDFFSLAYKWALFVVYRVHRLGKEDENCPMAKEVLQVVGTHQGLLEKVAGLGPCCVTTGKPLYVSEP